MGICAIKEDDDGTITADLSGTVVLPDSDGDGVPDASDNCPFVQNPNQIQVPPTIFAPAGLTVGSCAESHRIGAATAADVATAVP